MGGVTNEMAKRMTCPHEFAKEGPRVPLRYGSAATLVCDECNQWMMPQFDPHRQWRPLPLPSLKDDEA